MLARTTSAVAVALLCGVSIRLVLLILPPAFLTDVYYYDVQAVGYLLRGTDPYGAVYSVPASLATAGASQVFAYLPGVFSILAPTGAIWDPRLGLFICDILVAWSLFRLPGGRSGLQSSVYLLLPPTVLFSTWFLNDSLPAIAFLALAVLLETRKRPLAASLLWGISMAASQEAWFIFPLYAWHSLRNRRFVEVATSLAVALILVLPFLLWNTSAFLYDTLGFQFARHASSFISSGPFGMNVNPSLEGLLTGLGVSLPLAVRAGLVVLALLLILFRMKKSFTSLMLSSTLFVPVGLFLIAGDFFWSYLELPLVTLLAWSAIKGKEEETDSSDPFKA